MMDLLDSRPCLTEAAMVEQRVESLVRKARQQLESQLSQFVINENNRINSNKAYYEKKIIDLTKELSDCKERLEKIPEERLAIPANANKIRIANEESLIRYIEKCKVDTARAVRRELEEAEKSRIAQEQAEWAANV